jgi:hypothetical protein
MQDWARHDWAVVVGISHYPGHGLKPLRGPVLDAEDVKSWLQDPSGGGLTDGDRIKSKTSDDFEPKAPSYPHARPNPSDIQLLFDEIREEVRSSPEGIGRRLWVYMSGHGGTVVPQAGLDTVALILANSEDPDPLRGYPAVLKADRWCHRPLFREAVVILDCCRDISTNILAPLDEQADVLEGTAGRLATFLATGWGRKAREVDFQIDGRTVRRGLFTKCLLDVLRNARGRVDGWQLREAVQARMAPWLKALKLGEPEIRGTPSDDILKSIVFNEGLGEPIGDLFVRPVGALAPPELVRSTLPVTLVETGRDPADPWHWRPPVGQYNLRHDGKFLREPFQIYPGVETTVDVREESFQ